MNYDERVADNRNAPWQRPKTTRRYLHCPGAERIFVLFAEGKVLFGENIQGSGASDYPKLESYVFWPCYSKYLRRFDFQNAENYILEDGAPVHGVRFSVGGFAIEEEAFTDISERPTGFIRFRFTNTVPFRITENFAFLIRKGKEKQLIFGSPDIYTSYMPEISAAVSVPSTFEGSDVPGIVRDGDAFLSFSGDVPQSFDRESGVLRSDITLGPNETKELVFSFGKGEARGFSYEAERSAVLSYWKRQMERLDRLPEAIGNDPGKKKMIQNLVVQILQSYCRYVGKDFYVLRQGGLQRLIWPWDAMPALEALGRIGDFGAEIESVLSTYFDIMQAPSGEVKNFGEGWASVTACCLYSLSTYCLQKDDRAFFERFRDNMIRAFRWMEDMRLSSSGIKGAVAGLFPPLRGNDWPEQFQHWTFTDGLHVSAYSALLGVFKRFSDPFEETVDNAYRAYREALLRTLKKTVDLEGEDPVRIPLVPDGNDKELLDLFHPYLNHALPIRALHGLVPENLIDRVHQWALYVGAEENSLHGLLLSKNGDNHIFYTSAPDYDWFYEYLGQGRFDEARKILESTLCYSMTSEYYMIERYHTCDPYFTPWSPNVSANGRVINMTLDILQSPHRVLRRVGGPG